MSYKDFNINFIIFSHLSKLFNLKITSLSYSGQKRQKTFYVCGGWVGIRCKDEEKEITLLRKGITSKKKKWGGAWEKAS